MVIFSIFDALDTAVPTGLVPPLITRFSRSTFIILILYSLAIFILLFYCSKILYYTRTAEVISNNLKNLSFINNTYIDYWLENE